MRGHSWRRPSPVPGAIAAVDSGSAPRFEALTIVHSRLIQNYRSKLASVQALCIVCDSRYSGAAGHDHQECRDPDRPDRPRMGKGRARLGGGDRCQQLALPAHHANSGVDGAYHDPDRSDRVLGTNTFAIMGGLLVATILTLIFLPTLYVVCSEERGVPLPNFRRRDKTAMPVANSEMKPGIKVSRRTNVKNLLCKSSIGARHRFRHACAGTTGSRRRPDLRYRSESGIGVRLAPGYEMCFSLKRNRGAIRVQRQDTEDRPRSWGHQRRNVILGSLCTGFAYWSGHAERKLRGRERQYRVRRRLGRQRAYRRITPYHLFAASIG